MPPTARFSTMPPTIWIPGTSCDVRYARLVVRSEWHLSEIARSPIARAWRATPASSAIRGNRSGSEWTWTSTAPRMSMNGPIIPSPLSRSDCVGHLAAQRAQLRELLRAGRRELAHLVGAQQLEAGVLRHLVLGHPGLQRVEPQPPGRLVEPEQREIGDDRHRPAADEAGAPPRLGPRQV